MTMIYGRDGVSIGRSRGKFAERELQSSLLTLSEPKSFGAGQVNTAGMSDAAPGVSTVGGRVGLVTKSTRLRKFRANPIELEGLKADIQRVKEMRERMRRLPGEAGD